MKGLSRPSRFFQETARIVSYIYVTYVAAILHHEMMLGIPAGRSAV